MRDPYDTPTDPAEAYQRRCRQEAERARRREERRAGLIEAARLLLPDHGLALPVGRIAIEAGLPPGAAQRLFNTTADLAACLVRRAWAALIETTAEGTTAAALIAALIAAIRADRAAQRIHAALACGVPGWQRDRLAEAEDMLTLAVGQTLRERAPALRAESGAVVGRRALALIRAAALAPSLAPTLAPALAPGRAGPDAAAEAAVIAAMLDAAAALAPREADGADAMPASGIDPADDSAPAPDEPAAGFIWTVLSPGPAALWSVAPEDGSADGPAGGPRGVPAGDSEDGRQPLPAAAATAPAPASPPADDARPAPVRPTPPAAWDRPALDRPAWDRPDWDRPDAAPPPRPVTSRPADAVMRGTIRDGIRGALAAAPRPDAASRRHALHRRYVAAARAAPAGATRALPSARLDVAYCAAVLPRAATPPPAAADPGG